VFRNLIITFNSDSVKKTLSNECLRIHAELTLGQELDFVSLRVSINGQKVEASFIYNYSDAAILVGVLLDESDTPIEGIELDEHDEWPGIWFILLKEEDDSWVMAPGITLLSNRESSREITSRQLVDLFFRVWSNC
jgi:hypothetical protein